LLILDLRAPGVTVRPIPTIDGEQLNQIALDGVLVPEAHRVGPEDGAWPLIGEALAVERHVQFPPKRLRRDLEDLAAALRVRELHRDPVAQKRLTELAVDVLEAEVLAHAVLDAMVKGRESTAIAAENKLAHTEVAQRIARTALDLIGPEALLQGSMLAQRFCQSMWETIGGGTSEIMRSVIAREELGLIASR
jgi:alkylation response protein AidB-like acyl-CoA dehydrogenase